MLRLKRTSVIIDACSSSVVLDFRVSVCHRTACFVPNKECEQADYERGGTSIYPFFHFPLLTFLSWPPVASNFPSGEKWQHTTLLLLALTVFTSVSINPETDHSRSSYNYDRVIHLLVQ